MYTIAILHGAGYAGGELLALALGHPALAPAVVTSRAFAGRPVWHAHPALRGQTDLHFAAEDDDAALGADAVFITAEHGKAVESVQRLLAAGYAGVIVDLSADFRFQDPAAYEAWFGFTHTAPELLPRFRYGLPEACAPYPEGVRWIANPGCFASGIALSLWPLARRLGRFSAAVTALTGASGSGTRPKETTHFPTREGNVRIYKPFDHQHLPEVQQLLGPDCEIAFLPVSGPWTRGIWGTIQITLPEDGMAERIDAWYAEAYAGRPCIRLSPGAFPELLPVVRTPFCDIGWQVHGRRLAVGFALDNLMKGAASQAVQNLNLALGLPETLGLLPEQTPVAPTV